MEFVPSEGPKTDGEVLTHQLSELEKTINLIKDHFTDHLIQYHSEEEVIIVYVKDSEDITDPFYATDKSSGFDVSANESGRILPGETKLVGTGLRFMIPDGYMISVRPRSGISLKTNMWIKNSPGTIDTDYTGELKLIIHNSGEDAISYKSGDRLAQCIVEKSIRAMFLRVDSVVESESRGSGGFGSTGF